MSWRQILSWEVVMDDDAKKLHHWLEQDDGTFGAESNWKRVQNFLRHRHLGMTPAAAWYAADLFIRTDPHAGFLMPPRSREVDGVLEDWVLS